MRNFAKFLKIYSYIPPGREMFDKQQCSTEKRRDARDNGY